MRCLTTALHEELEWLVQSNQRKISSLTAAAEVVDQERTC
jgi:hypothetical protein